MFVVVVVMTMDMMWDEDDVLYLRHFLDRTDTYLVFVGIVGIVIYIWNVSVLIVVIVKVKSAQSEIQFATEKGKVSVSFISQLSLLGNTLNTDTS